MATLGYLGGAAALLAFAGWLIGWQVARSSAGEIAAQLLIVTAPVHGEPLRRALQRIGVAPHRVQILSDVSAMAPDVPAHSPDVSARARPVVTLSIDADGNALCTPGTATPQSYALRTVPFNSDEAGPDWNAIAQTIVCQLRTEPEWRGSQQPSVSLFEQQYRAAWIGLQSDNAGTLQTPYATLTSITARWPAGRDVEKSIALANLADVCIRLNEPPASRLARLLEGYNAAQEALRLQYAQPKHARINGLRALVERYRKAIHGYENETPDTDTVPRTPFAREATRGRSTLPVQRPADACPQANAASRRLTHASAERHLQ